MVRKTLFDANIYGKIALDKDVNGLIEKIIHSDLKIHDFELIRKELRKTSRDKRIGNKRKLRTILLNIYDQITMNNQIIEDKKIRKLANEYHKEYQNCGGITSKKKMIADFKIVACASLRNFYIIVSDDNKTMLSEKSRNCYDVINFKHKLKTPNFLSYERLKVTI